MNMRGDDIGTGAPRPTGHTRALPTATGHWQWKGTIPTGGPSRNRRGTAADMRRHTAAQTWQEPHSGHSLMRRPLGPPHLTGDPRDGRQSSG